jgi:hypothetical protein
MPRCISKFATRRIVVLRRIALVAVVAMLAGCNTTASTKAATPPSLYILEWDQDSQGGQGSETTIRPGGQFTVASTFLGPSKADIRDIRMAAPSQY